MRRKIASAAVLAASTGRPSLQRGGAPAATLLDVLAMHVAEDESSAGGVAATAPLEDAAVRAAWRLGAELSSEAAALLPTTFAPDREGSPEAAALPDVEALSVVPASALAAAVAPLGMGIDQESPDDVDGSHGAVLASLYPAAEAERFAACDDALALAFASLRLQLSAAQRHLNAPHMLGSELQSNPKALRALQRKVEKQARVRSGTFGAAAAAAAAGSSASSPLAVMESEWPLLNGSALADDRFVFGDQSHAAIVAFEALDGLAVADATLEEGKAGSEALRRREDVARNLRLISQLVERRACLSFSQAVLVPWLMAWLHSRQTELVAKLPRDSFSTIIETTKVLSANVVERAEMSLVVSDAEGGGFEHSGVDSAAAASGETLEELRVWAAQRSRAAHSGAAIAVQLAVAVAAASRALDAPAVGEKLAPGTSSTAEEGVDALQVLHAALQASRDGCALVTQREWAVQSLKDAVVQICGVDLESTR